MRRFACFFTVSALLPMVVIGCLRGAGKSSRSQQDQVVEMLRSGLEGLELAVQALRRSADPRLKEAAAYVIGESGQGDFARVLADSLTDPSEQVRRSAITALQKLVNPQALKLNPNGDRLVLPPPESLPPNADQLCAALQPLVRDRSPLVRASAAETIGWLRCNSSVAGLQELMHDSIEPVRFRASRALAYLTGKNPDWIDLDAVVSGPPPLMAVRRAHARTEAQQAGPFLRTAFFEGQGKFSYRGGIPAQFQTVLQVWRADRHLEFEADCQDESPADEGNDKLTFWLRPQGQSKLYMFEVIPARGLVRQAITTPDGRENETEPSGNASVERDARRWRVHLRIPFEAFGRRVAPAGEFWEANVVRTESHQSTGWGPEISSWTYFHRDFPGPPRLGRLYFADDTPVFGFRPAPENIYTFPFDQDSLPADQMRPIRPAADTLWGDVVGPNQLAPGTNALFVSQRLGKAGQPPMRLTVAASDYENRKVITSQVFRLPERPPATAQRIEFEIPETVESRAIDLDVVVSGDEARHELFRTRFIAVPVVSPPRRVIAYHLSRVKDGGGWQGSTGSWAVRDYGPMLMTESYPMALRQGRQGTVYGGTYPGGRLFSFDPATGVLEDLGSPSPPANHPYTLIAAPNGRLYGDLYRPHGRIFAYDLKARSAIDLGVPVPGAFSGECRVMAWANGRVYGTQRGHLFFAESATNRVVDKGSFLLNGTRYLPIKIASDAEGNLLGLAGGRLFRYLPERDEVRISDLAFDGWLLPGPQGKIYALFLDGRLFRWEPDKDELVEAARYAPIPLRQGDLYTRYRFRGLELVLTGTGELVVAQSGMVDPEQTALLVFEPGGAQPINLGNPVPGSLYLTALTSVTGSTVYGLSAQNVYGLGRTPVHLYSLTRAAPKTN